MVGYDATKSPNLTQLDYALAGGASGCFTRLLCQPLDVLKIRFQLQVEPITKNPTSKYKSIGHATALIVREEGPAALWKGHVPAQWLSVTYGVVQFWAFERLTQSAAHLPAAPAPLVNFACGALAGCAATLASFPFDVVRTRLVAQGERRRVYRGVGHCFAAIARGEGARALYRGLLPTALQVAPHAGVQFAAYRALDGCRRETTLAGSLAAGAAAGLLAKAAVYPFDLVKKRMQIQGFEAGREGFGALFRCAGLRDCLVRIYRLEGGAGLFKGLAPSLIKAVCATALHFSSYEVFCQVLSRKS